MIPVETVSVFYAVLALVANGVVLAIVTLRLAGLRLAAASDAYAKLRRGVGQSVLGLAWTVAALATIGSLYFSEIARFEPCRLCWYQRVAMYPLVILLGIAVVRADAAIRPYVLALAGLGAVVAAYHVALEWLPWLDSGACSAATPCTLVWFREFGFISLPYLALSAFLLILALMPLASSDEAANRAASEGAAP